MSNKCQVCDEPVLPQYDAGARWIGCFHQVCFSEALRLSNIPRWLKSAMLWYLTFGVARAHAEHVEEMEHEC
jgi:hypothetical protein